MSGARKIPHRLAATFIASACFLCAQAQLEVRYTDDYRAAGIFNVATKKWLVAPAYKQIQKVPYAGSSETFTAYEAHKGAKWLLLDEKGKPVPGAVFDSLAYSGTGRTFLVKSKGKYAVYELGKGVNDYIGFFDSYQSDRYYVPQLVTWIIRRGDKFALLNMHHPGKPAWNLEEIYAYGYPYTTGRYLLWARLNGKYGIIDSSGNFVIPPAYERLVIPRRNTYSNIVVRHFAGLQNGKWGLVNINGMVTAPLVFDTILTDLYTSRDLEDTYPVMPASRNGKWGVIDTSGNCALPCEYDSVPRITAHKRIIALRDGKKGVTDFNNANIFPFIYRNAEPISENYLHAESFNNFLFSRSAPADSRDTAGLWGLADNTGKAIREAKAKLIRLWRDYNDTADPRISAADDVRFLGWIWNEGGEKRKTVVYTDSAFVEDTGGGHMEGTDYYGYHFAGGKTGVVDREGHALVPVKYDELLLPCLTRVEGADGFIYRSSHKPSLQLLAECWLELKYPPLGRSGKKWAILNWGGRELTPFLFDSILAEPAPLWRYSEMNDSVMAARNLSGLVFKVYRNGLFGYYSIYGKELLAPAHKFDEIGYGYFSYSLSSGSGSGQTILGSRLYSIVRQDYKVKKIEALTEGYFEMEEVPGEFTYGAVYKPACFTYAGTLNLVDAITRAPVLKKWADDLMLKRNEGGSVSGIVFSDVSSQAATRYRDTVCSSKAAYDPQKDVLTPVEAGACDPHFFARHGSEWFLYDIRTAKCLNEPSPFDSVRLEAVLYQVFRGGRFEKYSYSYSGPFSLTLDLELSPFAAEDGYTLVARNCKLQYLEIPYEEVVDTFDEFGNVLEPQVRKGLARLPLVQKGEFNLYDVKRRPVFKTWPDEILLPAAAWEERFSITDSTSIVYKPGKIALRENMAVSDHYKGSLALRYGKRWKLVSMKDSAKVIDGLQHVKFADGSWIVRKSDETLYYSIADLSRGLGK